jgi:putative GTP pyrophosphokinase
MSSNIQFNFLEKMEKPSKTQVKKAGDKIRKDPNDELALDTLNKWRAFHIYPLNTFQTALKARLKRNAINFEVTAQRVKRASTIIDKLSREPKMSLDRMQDIGGLRAVLKDIKAVKQLEEIYLKNSRIDAPDNARGIFRHELKNKFDYIENPKKSGYRGVHLIYRTQYPSDKKEFANLLIELQLRSKLQHIWATAVETIGTFLGQGLKFNRGDDDWKDFFALVSSAFAIMEESEILDIHKNLTKEQIYAKVKEEYNRLKVDDIMQGFAITAHNIIKNQKGKASYYCLITLNAKEKTVNLSRFPKAQLETANTALLESEKNPDNQSVLVSISDIKKLNKAYPNYFLDAVDFLSVLKKGAFF